MENLLVTLSSIIQSFRVFGSMLFRNVFVIICIASGPGIRFDEYINMYLCEVVLTTICLYYVHIDCGEECVVFSCIVEINLLTY